jgi:hypothetical protein
VLLALIALVVVWAAGALLARPRPWALREQSDGEAVTVLAVKAGQRPLVVARVAFGVEDFEGRLYEARAEGRAKVAALNQKS